MYKRNETTPHKEWDFVVEPYETESVCPGNKPSEWKLKHEYGGDRTAIRLEVFMHVCSALQEQSQKWFGAYTNAHTLDATDPQWLHEDEVDMVKVVLVRFIKSQLDGLSLMNAFAKAAIVLSPKSAKYKAQRIINALEKALAATDGLLSV